MRILVHDFAGHAFTVQLSRALACLGHDVCHLYSTEFQAPKGRIEPRADDPDSFEIHGLKLARPFAKYDFVRRVRQELEYGRLLVRTTTAWNPDVVLTTTLPLDAQASVLRACRRCGIPLVFWVQDLISVAIRSFFSRRMPLVGDLIGLRYRRLERTMLTNSNHAICISEDFLDTLKRWGVDPRRLSVIQNWAAVEEYTTPARNNAWSAEQRLDDKFVYVYSGTLGIKHNPALLLDLARGFGIVPDVRVLVTSEGLGAEWLREHGAGNHNLLVLPFQPNERLPEVLASADVCVALLGEDAGRYSVPSKVLSYLSAGRPILASMPRENLAARIIQDASAGVVVSPSDTAGFHCQARLLFDDASLRERLGQNGAAYARREFRIGPLAGRFEEILSTVVREAGR